MFIHNSHCAIQCIFCTYTKGLLELCLRVQHDVVPAFAQMWPCDDNVSSNPSKNDSAHVISYNRTTGQLMSGSKKCLTPYSFNGADNAASGLVLAECVKNENRKVHPKQRFQYSFAHRLDASGRVLTGIQTTMCLALKSSAPLNSNVLQMWVKKLPAKRLNIRTIDLRKLSYAYRNLHKMSAVFLINSDKHQTHNVVINTRILSNIFPNTFLSTYSILIRDIWEQYPTKRRINVFDEYSSWIVKVPPRNSRFYTFELLNEHDEQNNLVGYGTAPKTSSTGNTSDTKILSDEHLNNTPIIEQI